jgi:hypothetical protein
LRFFATEVDKGSDDDDDDDDDGSNEAVRDFPIADAFFFLAAGRGAAAGFLLIFNIKKARLLPLLGQEESKEKKQGKTKTPATQVKQVKHHRSEKILRAPDTTEKISEGIDKSIFDAERLRDGDFRKETIFSRKKKKVKNPTHKEPRWP